jgi:hypothetical protein
MLTCAAHKSVDRSKFFRADTLLCKSYIAFPVQGGKSNRERMFSFSLQGNPTATAHGRVGTITKYRWAAPA